MSAAPTWAELGVEEMRRGIALLLQGNTYFAWQHSDNSYRPCHDLAQLVRFERDIFEGCKTCGFYLPRPDNLTRWGCCDFDGDGMVGARKRLENARRAFELLSEKSLEMWLEQSSPGRYHVWAIHRELIPAGDMAALLRKAAPECREVFPKQGEHGANSKQMGNLVRFPGRHQKKRTFSRIIARSGRVPAPDGIAPAPKPKLWQEPDAGSRLLSLYAQVTRGLQLTPDWKRFNAMQRIVGRLKGRTLDEAVAVEIHNRFYNQQREQIQTPIEKSRAHFLTWFRKAAPCNAELPDYPTTAAEETKIAALPAVRDVPHDRLAATVRLFLSAKKHADRTGREFCLSLPLIARRLDVSIGSASNYRNACYKVGIVEMVKRGCAITGKANTYKPGRKWPS
jgi:hypothetical protein